MPFDRHKVDMENETHANGHKFSITKEKKDILLKAIREGNYIVTACRLAGISKDTFLDWMCKGGDQRYTRAVKEEDAVEPYKSFVNDVITAEAEAESNLLGKVQTGADKDWKAASWMLERRYNTRWGGRDSRKDIAIGASSGSGATVVILLPDNGRDTPMSEDDAKELAEDDLDMIDVEGTVVDV